MKRRFPKSLTFILLLILPIIYFNVQQFGKAGHPWRNEPSVNSEKPSIENMSRRASGEPFFREWQETITIAGIGDILIHDRVYHDAKTGDGYDFRPMFEHFKPILLEPDILIANQESILGGTEIGLSTYPSFNSPHEVGDALIDTGVDIVSTANNHTLDRGEKAIQKAIEYYEKADLPYVGHYKDWTDKKRIRVIHRNGIDVAFLAYTYGTNGIPVPDGKEYLVNLIDLDEIRDEVYRAEKIADVIVMSIHWGTEYERFPSQEQKKLAMELANMGVDIIFGHHPHVLQPMEMIETDKGKTFVVYSLGNFLTGQSTPDPYKDFGGMVSIDITKTINEEGTFLEISNPNFYPSYVYSENNRNYQVVPLQDAENFQLPEARNKYDELMQHMFQWLP